MHSSKVSEILSEIMSAMFVFCQNRDLISGDFLSGDVLTGYHLFYLDNLLVQYIHLLQVVFQRDIRISGRTALCKWGLELRMFGRMPRHTG